MWARALGVILSPMFERARMVLSKRPAFRIADGAIALVMALLAELDVLLSPDWRGPTWVNAVVVPGMALALAWRCTRPIGTLAAVFAGLGVLSLAFGSSQAWSSVFIAVVAVYSAAAHGSSLPAVVGLTAAGAGIQTIEDPRVHSIGDALWSSTMVGLTLLAGFGGRRLRARGEALDEREGAFDREQQAHTAEAIADERRRISRELHDIVSHSLSVLVLQAGAVEQVLERDPSRAREMLQSMRSTGKEAVGEMARLLGLIRGGEEAPRGPQPSLADVEPLVGKMRDAGMRIGVEVEGLRRDLPAALELSAFRIVQEGITNALKHAGQAECRVVLRYLETEFEVEVADDGAGPGNVRGAGRGLAGIGERVAVFGGRIETGARPGGGWIVRAVFPRQP